MTWIDVPVRIDPYGRLPRYASGQSAGCDLYAPLDLIIRPGETALMPLRLTMALPDGIEAQIRPRSGLSLKTDLRLPNSPGTIDSDYRQEVGVILQNTFNPACLPGMIAADPRLALVLKRDYQATTLKEFLEQSGQQAILTEIGDSLPDLLGQTLYLDQAGNPYGTIYLKQGERIAQMILSRFDQAHWLEHDRPEQLGSDRGGGFGSTGLTDT